MGRPPQGLNPGEGFIDGFLWKVAATPIKIVASHHILAQGFLIESWAVSSLVV